MLDFVSVRSRQITMNDFAASLTLTDLRRLTEESVDRMLALLADATDDIVTFVPDDPAANDEAAADPADRLLAWTIAHNVVHATSSAEEYAVSAAELARGVAHHGRSRYEVPWETVTTVDQCRARLLESRRMRVASLMLWPDTPRLDLGYTPWEEAGWVNAKGIFTWGLAHDDDHFHQMQKILAQATRIPA